ncbi:hypothetical protein S83_020421, partial [Arachis hypogaea]
VSLAASLTLRRVLVGTVLVDPIFVGVISPPRIFILVCPLVAFFVCSLSHCRRSSHPCPDPPLLASRHSFLSAASCVKFFS